MKTALSLIAIAFLIGCGSYRGAQPTTPADVNDSTKRSNTAAASNAAAPSALSTERPEPQVENADVWDPNDDLHVANRMLERVKQEGVVRIASVHPSGNRYVFVGEFKGSRRFGPTGGRRPKTDLWLVNKDGAGLNRLTDNGESSDPQWSPSGDRIAFVERGSVKVIVFEPKRVQTRADKSGTVFQASEPPEVSRGVTNVEYSKPRWSPNGKALAALAKTGRSYRVGVGIQGTGEIVLFAKGHKSYTWNGESELVLDYGRLLLDWASWLFAPVGISDSEAAETTQGNAQDEKPLVSSEFLERLLKRLSGNGVIRISDYSIAPFGNRILFVGEFEGSGTTGTMMMPPADLWLIDRDCTGLRRLTTGGFIAGPAWSPSGKEIAFVDEGSVNIIDVKTRNVSRLSDLQAYHPKDSERTHENWDHGYFAPEWSPDGKVVAAKAQDEGDGGIAAVDARSGNTLFQTKPDTGYRFEWSAAGELKCSLGKFVFNWSSALFNRR